MIASIVKTRVSQQFPMLTASLLDGRILMLRRKNSTYNDEQRQEIALILQSHNIDPLKIFQEHPWIMNYDSYTTRMRFETIQKTTLVLSLPPISPDIFVRMVPFKESLYWTILCHYKQFGRSSKIVKNLLTLEEKVNYYTSELDTTEEDIIHNLDKGKNYRMILRNLSDIDNTMKILKDKLNFPPQIILEHRFLFSRTRRSLERRIKYLEEVGIPIQAWMLDSSDLVLTLHVDRNKEKQGNQGVEVLNIIQEKMNLSPKEAYILGRKNRTLMRKRPSSVSRILDLLINEEVPKDEILKRPYVFNFSEERIRQRLSALKPISGVVSLQYLKYQDIYFNQLLQKMINKARQGVES